tara:strand:+ start:149 stop:331 length:183 start_codon:yes stop_codon:yes gene_type:complete
MDTYSKGILTVIAICLVSITLQLSGTKPIDNAEAASMSMPDYNMISNRLKDIAKAIRECN